MSQIPPVIEKYERHGWPSFDRPDHRPPAGWSLSDLSAMAVVRNHSLSPDGKTVAFIWDRDDLSDIYTLPAAGGWPARRTVDRGPTIPWDDEIPTWSPDSQWLAFTMHGQVYVVARSGGLPRKLTDTLPAASAPVWLADSRGLLVSAERHGALQLVLTGLDGRWPQALTDDPSGNAWGACPSPAGDWVAYVHSPFDDLSRSDIRLVRLSGGPSLSLTHTPGLFNHSPRWRPDGRLLAYLSQASGFYELWLAQADGSQPRRLTRLECDLSDPAWSPDGSRLACIANHHGAFELVLVSANRGEAEVLLCGKGVYARPNWSPDGRFLTVEYENPLQPPDLFRVELETHQAQQLTFSAPPFLNGLARVMPQAVHFPSAGGVEIEALLYRPAVPNRAGVVYIHGGPNDQSAYGWDRFYQYLVAAGYTLLCPNYRGSTGYGRAFERLDYFDWGGGDAQDCLAAADFLARLPEIDPQRLACWGASHGAYLTNCSLARDPQQRFACGISLFGDASPITSWTLSSQRLSLFNEVYLGHPASRRAVYQASSLIAQAANVKAPMLLLHGLLDDIVPPQASEEWAQALRQAGKPYEFKTYANEPHGFLRRKDRLDAWQRIERFLGWYLLPERPKGAAGR